MVLKCFYCGTKSGKEKKRTFHRFPNKERCPCLFEKWIENMNIGVNIKKRISRSARLCSDHFEEKNFYQNNETIYLKLGSIPTIFQKYKTQCVICKVKKGEVSCSFYKFPIDKPELLKLWLSNIKIEHFYPTSKDVICSNHFEKKFLRYGQGKNLQKKSKAVPTIFPEYNVDQKLSISNFNQQTCMKTKGNNDLISLDLTNRNISKRRATPKTVQRSTLSILADHNYATSPERLNKKYLKLKQHYFLQSKKLAISKKRIFKLKNIIAKLQAIIIKNKKISTCKKCTM